MQSYVAFCEFQPHPAKPAAACRDLQTAQTVGATVTQISGLGDKAFSGVHDVKALFGNYSIDVSNLFIGRRIGSPNKGTPQPKI